MSSNRTKSASKKPPERFVTQWGTYHLESGIRKALVDLWENVFKSPRSYEGFFRAMGEHRYITDRQALLIWLFVRLNEQYRDSVKTKARSSSHDWYMPKFINPAVTDPISKDRGFLHTIFERPALKQIDLKKIGDRLNLKIMMERPSVLSNNYLLLSIPPHSSDSEILRVIGLWRKNITSTKAFKQIKGSNRETIIHCLLAIYLSEQSANSDFAKSFRAATNDIFHDKHKNQPHRSKSKIQKLLTRAKEIRDSAPFNFLFSAG